MNAKRSMGEAVRASDFIVAAPPGHAPGTVPSAFEFVRQLAADLSGGSLQLPGYPDAALQLQRLLDSDDADVARIVRVIGTEPMLAAQTLRMANSAALNPAGRTSSDLRDAVARLGFDALRSAAVGYAVRQLKQAAAFQGIGHLLDDVWRQSHAVAAACLVVARTSGRFNPDTAMLCGLVSGVGRLYLLTRAHQYPALLDDKTTYAHIVTDWHATIARSILESWSMNEDVVQAVQDFEGVATDVRTVPTLADVLSAGHTLAGLIGRGEAHGPVLEADRACLRLGLDGEKSASLVGEVLAELESLRSALQH
ncbi:MAG: hypothetical protein RL684_438 [Pseudomonadota bacterium]